MSADELDSSMNEAADASDEGVTDSEVSVVEVEAVLNDEIPVEEYTMTSETEDFENVASPITQAEVYENLKRIGELEDEKLAIQDELRRRTEQLRAVLKHIDRGSILYRMLTSALPGSTPQSSSGRSNKKAAPKPVAEKSAKKKAASPTPKTETAKKKKAKKPAKKQSRR